MKIVYDHQIFCLQRYGGISRYFCELANHIATDTEQEVDVFSPVFINEYLSSPRIDYSKGLKIPGFSGLGKMAALGIDTAIAFTFLRFQPSVDIFHETYYSGIDCRPRSAKRIITVFDMTHEKFPGMQPGRDKTRKAKALAVERADHVICISENTRRDLISLLDVPEEKTSVIYLGYSLNVEKVTQPVLEEKPYLLFVGQRGGYKNFLRLLCVYADSVVLRDQFSLVCFGGGGFSTNEQELMKSLGLPANSVIHISGGDQVLAGLYCDAAAFIYPSLYEGFGIPPLEAMSFACPVVCSNSSSLPEVVGDAAELFDPENEGEMMAAIEAVVLSAERSQLLVDRGCNRIKQFSWEKCAQDTLDVYNRVLRD